MALRVWQRSLFAFRRRSRFVSVGGGSGRLRGLRSRPRQRLGKRGRGGPRSGTVRVSRTQRRTTHTGVAALFRRTRLTPRHKFYHVKPVIGLACVISSTTGKANAAIDCSLSTCSWITFDSVAFGIIWLPSSDGTFCLRCRLRRPMRRLICSVD